MFSVYSYVDDCSIETITVVQLCEVVVVWLRGTTGSHAGVGTYEGGVRVGVGGNQSLGEFVRSVSSSVVRGEIRILRGSNTQTTSQ